MHNEGKDHTCVCVCNIYIYIERERERERGRDQVLRGVILGMVRLSRKASVRAKRGESLSLKAAPPD